MPPPRKLLDHANRPIQLSAQLGTGGEGSVFEIATDSNSVAKVYHTPATKEKETKLRAMVAVANAELLKIAAWPTAILHEKPGGPVVGLIMPRIKSAKEIHTLYSPAHRKIHFPHADWRFLIHTAINCAIAFDTAHRSGVVIGDVNQSNVFVSTQAMVALIDCDSFQVRHGTVTFGCEVGVPLFTPPELQNRSLRGLLRTPNHDSFGLAVLIFHLIYMGRHPFAGRFSGSGEMPIEKAISEFRYAYGPTANRYLMQPPLHTLPIGVASAAITTLFERAFSDTSSRAGGRPGAAEWASTLEALKNQLQACRFDPGYAFPRSITACPWCELIGKGAPNYFISVAFARAVAGQSTFVVIDISALWKQIEKVQRPRTSYTRPQAQRTDPTPLPRGLPTRFPPRHKVKPTPSQQTVKLATIIAGVLAIPLFFMVLVLAIALLASAAVFGGWWLWLEWERRQLQADADRERKAEIAPLLREIERRERTSWQVEQDLLKAEGEWKTVSERHDRAFAVKLRELRQYKQQFDSLQGQHTRERETQQHSARAQQLELYLQQTFISDADVNGVGSARLAALESYGIETAFDVSVTTVSEVPGFGRVLTDRVLDWRRQVESRFVYNPAQGVPQAAQQALDMKYRNLRQQLQIKLENGLQELNSIVTRADMELRQQEASIQTVVRRVRQAKADLSVLPEDED